MVHHDIEHFDDYLLAKLEQLERDQLPTSPGGRTLPYVDTTDHSGATRTAPVRVRQRRPRALPNLLENTLVARFRRVAVTSGLAIDPKTGRHTQNNVLTSLAGGFAPDRTGNGVVRDAWGDAAHTGNDNSGGLSLLRGRAGSRNRKNRKAVSAPCERTGSEGDMDELSAEAARRAADAARVLMAVDSVKQSRKKWIMDRTLGVPRQFSFEKPHFKLVYDKSGQYRSKQSGHTMTSAASSEDVRSARSIETDEQEDKAKKPQRPEIPGLYVFPKEENFIPRDYCKAQEAGVDWAVNQSKSRAVPTSTADLRQTAPPAAITDIRRRCRVSYPVTEALHKAGTSITKIKAKTLRPGEMKVTKVWQGTADPCVPPVHQARAIRVELPPSREVAVPIPSPYRIPFMANNMQMAN